MYRLRLLLLRESNTHTANTMAHATTTMATHSRGARPKTVPSSVLDSSALSDPERTSTLGVPSVLFGDDPPGTAEDVVESATSVLVVVESAASLLDVVDATVPAVVDGAAVSSEVVEVGGWEPPLVAGTVVVDDVVGAGALVLVVVASVVVVVDVVVVDVVVDVVVVDVEVVEVVDEATRICAEAQPPAGC